MHLISQIPRDVVSVAAQYSQKNALGHIQTQLRLQHMSSVDYRVVCIIKTLYI